MRTRWKLAALSLVTGLLIVGFGVQAAGVGVHAGRNTRQASRLDRFDRVILANAQQLIEEGRRTFRFNTFGDQDFWGGTLGLHRAIEGSRFGGVGPGLSPAAAASLGLKIDVEALPPSIVNALRAGQVNLNDPAVTLQLLK